MSFKYDKTFKVPGSHICKIIDVAWSPDGKRLACVNTDNIVYLYDDNGEAQDKFRAKGNADSAGGPDHPFTVTSMAYSADNARLALAQSDGIVYVYKLGLEWRGKKSISNKFPVQAGVVAVAWRAGHETELLFALADGSLWRGITTKNKAAELFRHPAASPVVSIATAPAASEDGPAPVFLGHADGSIYRINLDGASGVAPTAAAICTHPCTPTALTANASTVLAVGVDLAAITYSHSGRIEATCDISQDAPTANLVSVLSAAPAGDLAAAGTTDGFVAFDFDPARGVWQLRRQVSVPYLSVVTAIAWDPSGGRIALGTLTGGVCTYATSLRRARYCPPNSRHAYDFVWTSRSAIQISGPTGTFKISSQKSRDITKIDIYRGQFVVAFTASSLLLGNLTTFKLAEIDWAPTGGERFHFESDRAAMVYSQGELTIVDYERSTPLVALRTEHMSPYLVSCIVGDFRRDGADRSVAKLAYLVDLQTVRVIDIATKTGPQVPHDHSIDWLELNHRGTHLLFRDSKCQLHIYSLATGERQQLLQYVSYVQWVPDSDVIVAQSRRNLCVWYSIHKTEQPFIFEIEGQVQDIEKSNNVTEVLVQEDPAGGPDGVVGYQLDDNLVYFASAMESGNFEDAMAVLEPLERTPDTEAQWQQLADAALEAVGTLAEPARMLPLLCVAERCFAAVGDVARSAYLRRISGHLERGLKGDHLAQVRGEATLDILAKRWANAEQRYLQAGLVDDALAAYLECHRWADAVRLAEENHHYDLDKLRAGHMEHLLATKQLQAAARVCEREGDIQTAILHYINGGLPALAAQCIITRRWASRASPEILQSILDKLRTSGQHEAAADLLEHLHRPEEALESFRAAHNYTRAVTLASSRPELGGRVVQLQEEWGEHLCSSGQTDAAVAHFIEAGATGKAARAALASGNLSRAAALVDVLPLDQQEGLAGELASLFQAAGNLAAAAQYYVLAGRATAAVHMYFDASMWDEAHKTAVQYLEDEEQMHKLYWQRAQAYRAASQFPAAERTLIAIRRWDAAAEMYKAASMYGDYLRLVKQRPEQLPAARAWVAQELEAAGHLREAEAHYCEAGQWKAAVKMFRKANQWEDVVRVAKAHGGVAASKQVAYAWAMHLEVEEKKGPAAKLALLRKMGLVEYAVDYAAETADFEHAFSLAQAAGLTAKVAEIHLKHAMHLEDSGDYAEAEAAFLRASKPREAIEMYTHQQQWAAALRVAQAHDAGSVTAILRQKGDALVAASTLADAEAVFTQAHAPERAVRAYRDAGRWDDALRVARQWQPELVAETEAARAAATHSAAGGSDGGAAARLQQARMLERQGAYQAAVDAYMELSPGDSLDTQLLATAWQTGARLASQHMRGRAADIVKLAARNLAEVKMHEAAAALHLNAGDKRAAVTVLFHGGADARARQVAAGDALLEDLIDQLAAATAGGGADGLAGAVSVSELDDLARRGNWAQVHARAAAAGAEVANHYLMKDVARQVAHGYYADVAHLLRERGAPATVEAVPLLTQLALGLLRLPEAQRSKDAEAALKAVLCSAYSRLAEVPGVDNTAVTTLRKCHDAVHFLVMHTCAEENGWPLIAAQAATTLLRCLEPLAAGAQEAPLIPADKAFYLAGMAWRKVPSQQNDAFVWLNAFLDVVEAMEDGNAAGLDLSDLADCGICTTFELPAQDAAYVGEGAVERVKSWVLEAAMQQDVGQTPSTRTCANCGGDVFAGQLTCGQCWAASEACVVTGWPIPAGEKVHVKGVAGLAANRKHYNTYVGQYGTCPFTGNVQAVVR
eukprot:jgi/Ulvmu1/10275/UM060_0077.1